MSDPDPLDISARDLMPGWLDDLETPNKYADFAGEEATKGGKRRGGGRPPGGRGRDSQGRGDSRERGRGGPPRGDRGKGKGPGRDGREKGRGRGKWEKGGGKGRGRDERRPAGPSLEGIETTLLPDRAALEAIAKYVKQTCRAYPMWDIARAMLGSRERYRIRFRKSEGAKTDLIRCKLDESIWLSRDEALRHVLRSDAIRKYYRVEEVKVDPPRGNFTAIAVHRKSGVILGPPNHHEYRPNMARLHRERFSHVPFDRFQREIETRRDEESIEAWKESRSVERHYVYLDGKLEEEPDAASEAPAAEAGAGASGEAAAAEKEAPPPGPLPEVEGESPEAEGGEPAGAEAQAEAEAQPEAQAGAEAQAEAEAQPEAQAGADAEAEAEAEAEVEVEADKEGTADEGAASAEVSGESDGEGGEVVDGSAAESGESAEPDDAAGEESQDEPEPAGEAEAEAEAEAKEESEKLVFESEETMAKHFMETHGDDVFKSVGQAFVGGDIPGRNISGPLLSRLRSEVETRQRAPMTLIQDLCRGLEKCGLRFFKEGKKLFVAAARPRVLDPGTPVAEPVQKILDFLRDKPSARVPDLMKAVVPGFEPPKEGEDDSARRPSTEEKEVMRHLHWLASEGYVVEYSSGKVRLGGGIGEAKAKGGGRKGKKRGAGPDAAKGGAGEEGEEKTAAEKGGGAGALAVGGSGGRSDGSETAPHPGGEGEVPGATSVEPEVVKESGEGSPEPMAAPEEAPASGEGPGAPVVAPEEAPEPGDAKGD